MSVRAIGMEVVFEVGLGLPGVEESTYYGARALKLHGQMMVCKPMNKSAEANSAVVAMSFERRASLLKARPALYYITDHYAPHPTVLIRLSRISRVELERALRMAWESVSSARPVRRARGKASAR